MSKLRILLTIFTFEFTLVSAARAQTGENVNVHAGINHDEFDRLLKKYVNEQGLVNYGAWKQNTADIAALDNYLKQFAANIECQRSKMCYDARDDVSLVESSNQPTCSCPDRDLDNLFADRIERWVMSEL